MKFCKQHIHRLPEIKNKSQNDCYTLSLSPLSLYIYMHMCGGNVFPRLPISQENNVDSDQNAPRSGSTLSANAFLYESS